MAGRIHDLGYGVTVDEGLGDGPVVTSTEAVLPWRPRSGQFVGTAVIWCDRLFEARSVKRSDGVGRWRLAPWPEGEVARNVERLDADRIESLLGEAAVIKKSRGIRFVLVFVSPLAGLMPGFVQRRWEREHNVPGGRATILSAVVELALGTWWIVHPVPVPLRFFGWLLFTEAMVRLWFGLTQSEPMGSFLTAPFGWVTTSSPKEPGIKGGQAEVVRWSQGEREMALAMSDPRVDWLVDGVIRFRGSLFRLVEKEFGGDRVVYHFEAVPEDTLVTLSLAPPARQERHRDRGRGFVADAGRFVLLSFAPRRFQERLTPDLNLGVRTLTWISAGVELFGGVVNLLGGTPRDAWVGLDLLFAIEGAWRLVRAAVTGLPVGSVLGLPFVNVYERWARSDGE